MIGAAILEKPVGSPRFANFHILIRNRTPSGSKVQEKRLWPVPVMLA
jgi:hypothetical protein